MARANVVLLGPQRLLPTLNLAFEALAPRAPLLTTAAPIAAITAGWEEREAEDRELSEHLWGRVRNLHLYERTEDAYRRDPELFAAMRARHTKLRRLQQLYRIRLGHELAAARELLARSADTGDTIDPELLALEQEEAIGAVRELDARHLDHIEEVHAEFVARVKPLERAAVQHHRRELGRVLGECCALCVAGGQVAILLNRMRLFDVIGLLGEQPVFCWSAGAMALSERVVVFHDDPPHGAGNPEVLELGLGVHRGVVALPHASHRLRLSDRLRVSLFARRFAPAACVALDPRTRLTFDGERWQGIPGTRRLERTGELAEVGAA
jgi:hypothetical protein